MLLVLLNIRSLFRIRALVIWRKRR